MPEVSVLPPGTLVLPEAPWAPLHSGAASEACSDVVTACLPHKRWVTRMLYASCPTFGVVRTDN